MSDYCKRITFGDVFLCPPLKKGAYCYATVGRSVRMSVCRSVDQVLFGQYLLTPSLDQYQIGAGVALNKLMIPFDFQVT